MIEMICHVSNSALSKVKYSSSSSSSSSSSESDLGGAITLLLQDHRTTNKSVCKQPEHSNSSCCSQSQCAIRRHGTKTGTKLTSIPVGRQGEKQHCGRVVVVHSMHVQQPLGTNDRPG